MEEKLIRKFLRRQFSPLSWSLVAYYLIMNIMVILTMAAESARLALSHFLGGNFDMDPETLMEQVSGNAWGYQAAVAVGLVILLAWKGWDFFREEVFAKTRRMNIKTFLCLACVFLGCQVAASVYSALLEAVLNLMGLSALAALEAATVTADTFSMFLYASIVAPIAEELIFRGFLQRSLMPYGKKFAIFASALLFGLFHGNLIQTPYAFLVGLVLGYTAAEYSIWWAVVLHMVNNFLLADLLPRLLSWLPVIAQNVIMTVVIWALGIAGNGDPDRKAPGSEGILRFRVDGQKMPALLLPELRLHRFSSNDAHQYAADGDGAVKRIAPCPFIP